MVGVIAGAANWSRNCGLRAGSVSGRSLRGSRTRRSPRALDNQQHLSRFDGLARLDQQLGDLASDGTGQFDDGLVSLQFHQDLAAGDRVAFLDRNIGDVGRGHAFAKTRELELDRAGGYGRRLRGGSRGGRWSGLRTGSVSARSLAGADAGAVAAPAPSITRTAWPTVTVAPSFTRMRPTTPAWGQGSSTTALSVSSSITIWPAESVSPSLTRISANVSRGDPSPRFGSLNSIPMDGSVASPAVVASYATGNHSGERRGAGRNASQDSPLEPGVRNAHAGLDHRYAMRSARTSYSCSFGTVSALSTFRTAPIVFGRLCISSIPAGEKRRYGRFLCANCSW